VRLVTIPTWGDHSRAVASSSWKLDNSSTTASSGSILCTEGSRDTPMFPPSHVLRPQARSMAASSAVVVDLPLLPVTAATGAGQRARNMFMGLVTGTAACRAARR